MDPFDLSIIFSAIRNFGDSETIEAVRGQQSSALERLGSNLKPDDLRSMFLGKSDPSALMNLLGQDRPGSTARATRELGSVNRALDEITSGGLGVQEEIFDLLDERSSLENTLGALEEGTGRVPGKRSAFRRGARAVGRVAGPISTALFSALDANRFNQDPTRETARSIAEEIGNPAMSIGRAFGLDEATASQLPRIGGANPGDLVPVTNAIADFLFRGLSQQRESRSRRDTSSAPRRSPTGS